jgi:hypothetical protein
LLAPDESGSAFLFFVVRDVVHARDLLDLEAAPSSGTLDDPGERAVQAGRLILDFLEHGLREIQALLPLIAPG